MSDSDSDADPFHPSYYQIKLGGVSRIFPTSAEFVIGRGRSCDLRLVASDVSRIHCEIRCTYDGWKLKNKSLYGLTLNGTNLKGLKAAELHQSNIMMLGSVKLRIITDVDKNRYRIPVRTLRFTVSLSPEQYCLNLGNALWERKLRGKDPNLDERCAESTEDEKMEFESEDTATTAETKKEIELPNSGLAETVIMDELIKLRQDYLRVTKKLEERDAAYKRVLDEKNDAMLELNDIRKRKAPLNLEEILESELQCSICQEVVVNAITSNCSHTFCEYCFLKWTKKSIACPVCRSTISKHVRTKIIDNCLEKFISHCPADYQERRREILEARKGLTNALTENPRPRKRRKRSTPAVSHSGSQGFTITLQNLGILDTTIDVSSDDDSPVFLFQERL